MFNNKTTYRRQILLLFFLQIFFAPVSFFAQNFDSLLNEIHSFDRAKQIEILSSECWKYRSKNPDYAKKAGAFALKLIPTDDFRNRAKVYNFLGVIERNIGDFPGAMEYYQSALHISTQAKDSLQMAYAYNNIGGLFRMQGQYNLALENIFNSLNIFDRIGEERGKGYCYINLGIVYRELGQYDKALDYLDKCYDIVVKYGDLFAQTLTLNHKAETYKKMGDYEKTYSLYLKLLNDYIQLEDTKGEAVIDAGIAEMLIRWGNDSEAERLLKESLRLHKQIKNVEGIVNSYILLSKIYINKNDFSTAKKYLDKAKTLLTGASFIKLKMQYQQALSEYYKASKQYKYALDAKDEYYRLRDSLAAEEEKMKISALEGIYRAEKLSREKLLLEKDIELNKNKFIYMLVISVLVGLFLVYFIVKERRTQKLNALLKQNNITKDKFFGIIAHDLKNPFNSILGYSELLETDFEEFDENQKKEAIKEIHNSAKKLYAMVTNLLEWARAQTNNIELNKEPVNIVDEIRSIIEILKPQADRKNIKIELDESEEITAKTDVNVFHTIIRNLLNNAIKFTPVGGTITVSLSQTHKNVVVSIIDTGVGMSEDKVRNLFNLEKISSTKGTANETGTGLGLILVKELVDKCDGKIAVQSEENVGTTFTVSFPKE